MQTTTAAGFARRIALATERMRLLTGSTFDATQAAQEMNAGLEALDPKGDKPIPNRKRRFHDRAPLRAEKRWNGMQKMLKFLEPAGVQSGPLAMDALSRKYGL